MSRETSTQVAPKPSLFAMPYAYVLIGVLLIMGIMIVGWFYATEWYRERLLTEARSGIASALTLYSLALQESIESEMDRLEHDIMREEPVALGNAAHLVSLKWPSGGAVRQHLLVAEFVVYQFGIAKSVVYTPVELDPIVEQALGAVSAPARMEWAIRSSTGEVFYGSRAVFDSDPVLAHVVLLGDFWDVAAIPSGGWNALIRAPLMWMRWGLLVIIVTICGLIYQAWFRHTRLGQILRERNEALRSRLELERLVIGISKDLIVQTSGNPDDVIMRTLEVIAISAGADRSHVFLFCPDGKTMDLIYDWCAPNVASHPNAYRHVLLSDFPWLVGCIKSLEAVVLPQIPAETPTPAFPISQTLYAEGVKSAAYVPLIYGDQAVGFLGLQSLRSEKQWTDETITLLKLVADMLAGALKRRDAELALRQSEERYRTVVEASRDVIYVRNVETGAYEYISPSVASVMGFSADYLCSVPTEWLMARLHPDDCAMSLAHLDALRRGVRPHHDSVAVEYRWRCADGLYHWFSDNQVVVCDESGKPVRMVGSKRDITARKEAERRLLESEARFRNLFENIGDALVLLDEDLRVVDYKDTADRIIGFEASEMLGRRFEQAIERLTVMYDGPAIPLTKIICAQKPTMYRAVRLAKSDTGKTSDVYLDVLAYPVQLGGRPHVALLCRDVTELRRLEAERQQTESLEILGRLALDVAHDFGKFLAIIKAEVELLQEYPPDTPLENAELQVIADAADSGVALTRELIAFARGESVQFEILHLNLLVENTEAMLRPMLNGRVKLHLDLIDQPLFFWGDEAKFQRIMINLTSNALNAMPTGGILTIETRLVELDATSARARRLQPGLHARLTIRDTGVGISDENQRHIFEPFFTTQRSELRAGLGLAAVYGIVQQHHGHICVESQLGQGTAFHLFLPLIEKEMLAEAAEGGA